MYLSFKYYGRLAHSLLSRVLAKVKFKNVEFGHRVRILDKSILEGNNKIHDNTVFGGKLGRYSYIGANSSIMADIGRFCSIGSCVRTVSALHPVREFISTHPAFYSTGRQCNTTFVNKQKFDEWAHFKGEVYSCHIGNDVFIGENVLLVGLIEIGDGAVIGAGSVVVKNIDPYSIVVGNPAKEIDKRYDKKTIEQLLQVEWWNKCDSWLKKNGEDFENVEKTLNRWINEMNTDKGEL